MLRPAFVVCRRELAPHVHPRNIKWLRRKHRQMQLGPLRQSETEWRAVQQSSVRRFPLRVRHLQLPGISVLLVRSTAGKWGDVQRSLNWRQALQKQPLRL